MAICPACGTENTEGSKFCSECGTPLAAVDLPIQERKVVSALFCDLVGFTSASEASDPEDIDRMLSAYATIARERIEAHGGVVEKFIGDAVVGIFGAPVAHEDDPERAVRAGLRIIEDAESLEGTAGEPLRLRIGINTGETLVHLGVTPGSGERILAGDAINTASRIQSVAPEMGVAVGLTTYQATVQVFAYEELPPATLKGKAKPVRVFHAKEPLARLGTDLTRTPDAEFVGREIDLALLRGIFEKTVASDSPQLVTVIGEPGLGKTRLVAELLNDIDARPELVTWRQGRCLPYGEGITFWALGEIVKAHAGILESDPPAIATRKLEAVLPGGDERAWFLQRLLPLLGVEAGSEAAREEQFTAWRRFLEHLADVNPTVLVFEDLHWADDAMLAFLDHLAERAEGVPLLVIGTARPELHDNHPGFGGSHVNVNTIRLTPLTDAETARLVSSLLDASVLPADLQQPILERAGGNPLYAGEFVRLLKDRDLLVQRGAVWELRRGAEVPFPDSIQALIAARLDTLPPDTKSLLADAAVVGKVFWAGSVTAMGARDPDEVVATLRTLSRKEFVRPARRSSIEGEAEYAFWHALARDVSYGQLPRAVRVDRHVAAARWIESRAPERVEDLADVLAYHYTTALGLAEASGDQTTATELRDPALRFLILAGERALGLDTSAALANLERALALAPIGHRDRPRVLARFGEAAQSAARFAEAAAALEEAIDAYRAAGDLPAAATTMTFLSRVLQHHQDPRTSTLPDEALALLEPLAPSPALVDVLAEVTATQALSGASEQAIVTAERTLVIAADLGLPQPARALGYRGLARTDLGDAGGLDDFREAIALATEAGLGREAANNRNNFGSIVWVFEGPEASLVALQDGIAFARARGLNEGIDFMTGGTVDVLVQLGRLEEAVATADDVIHRLSASGDLLGLADVRCGVIRARAIRGEMDEVSSLLAPVEDALDSLQHAGLVIFARSRSAMARAALGHATAATAHLSAVDAIAGARENSTYVLELPLMARTATGVGAIDLAERLLSGFEPRYPAAAHALVAARACVAEARLQFEAAAEGYADAARRWETFGGHLECAHALVGLGRSLIELGRPTEATVPLRDAHERFAGMGAAPLLAEVDALLGDATALSS
jgi:class 3 adenylate cyclase/tetratricopeptide (TPR) repeat protein